MLYLGICSSFTAGKVDSVFCDMLRFCSFRSVGGSETADSSEFLLHLFLFFKKRQENRNEGEMERQRADGIWTEGNPRMRAASNNHEDLLEGGSGSGPPSAGQGSRESKSLQGQWSHSMGVVCWFMICVFAHLAMSV